MSKQLGLLVAVVLVLTAAMVVWALRMQRPASMSQEPLRDHGTALTPQARPGKVAAASGRSTRGDEGSRLPARGTGTTAPAVADSSPPAGAASAGTNPGARTSGSSGVATLESVTVGPTYDASNTDVTPPVLLTPLVPRSIGRPRANAPSGDVRILVNEDGTVASVRATVDPKTMSEAILITNALSQAKTWHFQPATKDGKPVRYSFMMPISRF